MKKNILKICFISAFGLALLQATPNFKGEKVADEMPVSVQKTRAGGLGGLGGLLNPYPELVDYGTIQPYSLKEVFMKKDKVAKMTFTPSEAGLYVISTYSDFATQIAIVPPSGYGTTYYDSGATNGTDNAEIILKVASVHNQTYDVYVAFEQEPLFPLPLHPNQYRSVDVYLRKAVFNSFTVNDPVTAPLTYTALNKFQNKCNYFNFNETTVASTLEDELLKKEFVLVAGRDYLNGFGTELKTQNTSGPINPFGPSEQITVDMNFDMHGNQISVWANKHSATEVFDLVHGRYVSLIERAVENGSRCAVGFNNSNATISDMKEVLDIFFERLGCGETINEAYTWAKYSFLVGCGGETDFFSNPAAEGFTIVGNSSFAPYANSQSNGEFYIPGTPLVLK